MKKYTSLIVLALIFNVSLNTIVHSQNAGFDIFLVEMKGNNADLTFGVPVNITDRDGYNNQPFFDLDGKFLLFSSERNGQNDIFKYDLKSGETTQLTNTPNSEYSPTLLPDKKFFSVIKLDLKDGTQPLLKFPINGGESSLIYENGEKVGYHAWSDKNTLAMFILGNPAKGVSTSTLQILDTNTGKAETVFENIGRSIHKIPGKNEISFTHNLGTNQAPDRYIKKIDMKSREISSITKIPSTNEFYAWTKDRVIVGGNGTSLMSFRPGKDTNWVQIADFSEAGIKRISRIAIDPKGKRIAIVSAR